MISLIPGKKYDFRRERAVRKAGGSEGEGLSNARMFLSYFIHPACTRASFSFLEWLPLQTLLATLLVLGHSNGNTHLLYNRSWRGHPLSVSRRRAICEKLREGEPSGRPAGFLRRSMAFRRRQPSFPYSSNVNMRLPSSSPPIESALLILNIFTTSSVGRSTDFLRRSFGLIG